MDPEELGRMLRSGEVTEDQITCVVQDDFSLPADCDDPAAFVRSYRDRLIVLKQAHLRFEFLARAYGQSNLEFERYYRDLYDDIIAHRNIWFDVIFSADNSVNPVHAERTTGILGTLCTILRQRGDLEGCMEIMPTYMAVLERYQQMTDGCGRPSQVECCEGLTYKANLIRINCGVQLPDQKMAVRAFRDAIAYEKKLKALGQYDVDSMPDFDGVMEVFFHHKRYEEVPDDDIFKALTFFGEGRDPAPAGELRVCGYCESREDMFGDHKKCSRCHEQPYCSKECQAQDWPCHKQLCGSKNNTNLSSASLLEITKILVKNHTITVEQRTGRPLSACQKDAAKAALVKHLKKMFTGEFKHFNSPCTASDAASDPAFCAALADLFAQQPGYEKVWGKLRVGYKEEMERQLSIEKRSHSALNIDEDTIRDVCTNVARTLIIRIGAMMGTADILNGARRDKLLNDLVTLVKNFALKHPEYNSHRGLQNMVNNDEFKALMVDTVTSAMEIDVE
mmetsp:Transcript_25396/g.54946  ORF Transcript_25396/g.54946 Transcript_25396/m.54946 type:complete len:507 (+) Transcript_25396:78-1598(+)